MNMEKYADYLVEWIEQQRTELYQMDAYVLGVSGGVDSAVCAHLLAKTGKPVYCYMLPTDVNHPADLNDANAVLKSAKLQGDIISIQPMYDTVMQSIQAHLNPEPERINVLRGNLMARLRMVTLFTLAQSHRAIVVGTDNAAELYTGYFTKFGDGAADIFPLSQLRKEQVYELGRILGVPESILQKAPSAGLWQGQTDEDEMGVTYAELDAFLRGESVSEQAKERIDFWHNRSKHKRILPPIPPKKL